jgi:uncharacterized surface protein with fasciclin (FAS1) repeats
MRLVIRISLAAVGILVLLGWAVAPVTTVAQIVSDKPNDATQGRLRINQCVAGAPRVDAYVNGQQAVNGGVPQTIRATETTGYLYLSPGTYSVALVPAGQGLDHPFLSPLDVQVAAGHRYTLVALGQKEDPAHKGLMIDETAAYQAVGAAQPDGQHLGHITVNNIKGAPSIHFALGGVAEAQGAAYGEFEAAPWPAFASSIDVVTANAPSEVIAHADGPIFNPPGSDNMDCVFGTYPGTNDSHTTATTSTLNPSDFLQRFNDLGSSTGGQTPTFHTFLSVLRKAGLEQMLVSGGPYLLFAPTDDAFAALPKDKLDALLADPKAMVDLVRSHLVQGYYPISSLNQQFINGAFNRTVTNMLGTELVLTGSDQLTVNGDAIGGGGDWEMVANGTRLFWVSKLILPAPAAPPTPASPAPGMPATGAGAAAATIPAWLLAAILIALVALLIGSVLRCRGAGQA